MGVPKFFRWISERYPCLSELVKEYQIPEFDHLYLDMNGIIHTCSHPNDFDPHFRITEEKIFKDIFHYIEVLFRMIQPQRLFFMAVDGVAPRAKQNQQRGRRFRSAKEAEVLEAKAKLKGEALPEVKRFDSNCITPGTPFMVRLQEQLKFFVAYKISTDDLWMKCRIILSGHETPGEGEHKIMDYIRYIKAQSDYDPNTRHCLYGLDADLIMLGLCSHEPHFSLLREEVRFDRKNQQRISTAEETTFFLLHLSLMREYLEHEFAPVKNKLPEGFHFDLESIIDDWVLMGFLVGNDFIPPLPELHINTGALPILYQTYIDVLPTLGGYINEAGTLNLARFQKYMERLGKFDLDQFDDKFADLQYFQAKTGRRPNEKDRTSYKKLSLCDTEKLIAYNMDDSDESKPSNPDLDALIQSTNDVMLESSSNDDGEESSDEFNGVDSDATASLMMAEFRQHKKDYYMNKLDYKQVTPSVLRSQAEGYVRAIQWNLNYYYNGVCSWSWYYPHHYAPFISDIKDFADMKLDFDLGTPFLPFQQLLAVLPAASKDLVPEAYQWLMTSPKSPIISFYPADFETDLNGKKQEWEAVVLIPFIDETALLSAMDTCTDRLLPDEVARNCHGPMCVYTYTIDDLGPISPPAYFPKLQHNHARLDLVDREDIYVDVDNLVKGLCPGVRMDVFFPGFPTLKHVPHTSQLSKAKVKVFEQPSRGENMVLTVKPRAKQDLKDIAADMLDQVVYVQWPHLIEAKVVSVSTTTKRCELVDGRVEEFPMLPCDVSMWQSSRKAIVEGYATRRGVQIGETEVLVKALVMIGRKYTFGALTKITLEKQWAGHPSTYALQAVVKDISVHDPSYVQYKTLDEVFPVSSQCFILAGNLYGHMGEVAAGGTHDRVKLRVVQTRDPDLAAAKETMRVSRTTYMQGGGAAARLGISAHLLSRVTGNIFVQPLRDNDVSNSYKTNIGLSLKYTKKNEEIPGYTRRDANATTWLYSHKAVELVNSYMQTFPDLFEYLNAHTGNDDMSEEDIFPEVRGRLTEISAWLKQQEYTRIERQACGSSVMEKEVVEAIEAAMDVSSTTEQRSHLQVKPYLLYKPELHTGNLPPDLATVYTLFDRVVNVRKGFTVPLGLKGVVIGIHKSQKEEEVLYDVVFDSPFTGGLTLNCSPNRAYRMPRNALINISHGQRVELGVQAPSEGSWFGSAFAPVERSRPHLPNARMYDGAELNDLPSFGRNQGDSFRVQQVAPPLQQWRTKPPPEPVPAYTLLSKSQPPSEGNDDYQAMWDNLQAKSPGQAQSRGARQVQPLGRGHVQPLGRGHVQRMGRGQVQPMGPGQVQPMDPGQVQPMGPGQVQPMGPGQVQPLGRGHMQRMGRGHVQPMGSEQVQPMGSGQVQPMGPGQVQPRGQRQMQPRAALQLNVRTPTHTLNKAPDASTNFLKQILGIPPVTPAETNLSVQDIFQHARSQDSLMPPCVQLLNLFQERGLGTPRYNYTTEIETGLVKATVMLPDGVKFTGASTQTKEQASDNAARNALKNLVRPVSNNLPTPPQQWREPQLPGPPTNWRQKPTPPFSNLPITQPKQAFAFGSQVHVQQKANKPQIVSNGKSESSPQQLIRVTGAPPATREATTMPRLAEVGYPFQPQMSGASNEGVPTNQPGSKKKKPQRIAANFKAAKKISKTSICDG